MATSAFKSTSKRGTTVEPKAASRRRSHSVSAVSRKIRPLFDDNASVSAQFSNSRDNPLFWSTSSPPDKDESLRTREPATSERKLPHSLNSIYVRNENGGPIEQRGRTITRSSGGKNGIGRSLSRIRGRSVSRAPYNRAHELEIEQDVLSSTVSQSRNESKKIGNSITRTTSVRNKVDKTKHSKISGVRMTQNRATEWSEDDSACSLPISSLEDGFSVGSLSEADDKTTKPAFEELNVFRRNNTYVTDIPSDFVNPVVGDLIVREYAIKLEESEERARKLRADLAVEEHRGQELDRVLKEILPDSETSATQRPPRRGRKASNERKRMSKRLTEEAMTYFDECVSLSTFDSSDFSASEDPLNSSVRAMGFGGPSLGKESPGALCYDQGSILDQQQIFGDFMQLLDGSASSSGSSQLIEFSFSHKVCENGGPEEDIRSCIKNFERDGEEELKLMSSYYDLEKYSKGGNPESLLMERVLHKSQMESGRLFLCPSFRSLL